MQTFAFTNKVVSLFIFSLAEYFLIAFYVRFVDLGAQVQKLIVALGVGVIVHNIHVGLRIVVIHLVVPGDGVCTGDVR